jgi:hypothetical protein
MNPPGVVMSAEQVRATPVRLQRSRKKGSRLVSPNGLRTVCCSRPGKYGNPFRAGDRGVGPSVLHAVSMFSVWARHFPAGQKLMEQARSDLPGKNLACWCRLCPKHRETGKPLTELCPDCAPCHVDVIGELVYARPAGVACHETEVTRAR